MASHECTLVCNDKQETESYDNFDKPTSFLIGLYVCPSLSTDHRSYLYHRHNISNSHNINNRHNISNRYNISNRHNISNRYNIRYYRYSITVLVNVDTRYYKECSHNACRILTSIIYSNNSMMSSISIFKCLLIAFR